MEKKCRYSTGVAKHKKRDLHTLFEQVPLPSIPSAHLRPYDYNIFSGEIVMYAYQAQPAVPVHPPWLFVRAPQAANEFVPSIKMRKEISFDNFKTYMQRSRMPAAAHLPKRTRCCLSSQEPGDNIY